MINVRSLQANDVNTIYIYVAVRSVLLRRIFRRTPMKDESQNQTSIPKLCQAGSHMPDESEERNWHARADNNSRGSESSKNEWNKLDYTMELSIILYRTRVGMLVSTPNGVVVTYILARPSINHSSILSCIALDLGEYFIWRERKWTTKMNNKRKIYLSSASALPMHYTISWNITLPKNQILVGPKQSPGNRLM